MTGEDITSWRNEMGFSQAAAARALGIAVETMRAYERGQWTNKSPAVIPDTIAGYCEHMLAVRRLDRANTERSKPAK